ncbi:kyphoscoliosis peptidase-like [Discoglossus pictus]
MAPHHRLKLWQKLLLGIFCFPLLPIYLCVYYLSDSDRPEWSSALVPQDLSKLAINSAALSEVHLPVEGSLQDAAGYTLYWSGKPKTNKSLLDVGFMNKQQATIFSVFAPTVQADPAEKDKFYTDQRNLVQNVPTDDKVNILGDFNARLGKYSVAWKGVLGNHGQVNDAEESHKNKNLHLSNNKVQDVEDQTIYPKTEKQKYKLVTAFSYPWDRSNLKSLQIDLEAFKKLDAYASKLNTKGSLDFLMKDLLRDVHTDQEKIRAIWIWICYHIEYDIAGLKNKALRSTDPSEILRTRKGVCAGYSSLFEKMCNIAGVQCKTIIGYAKGAGYEVGQNFSDTNHAWNMVYLEKGWHLLDSTWGAGCVNESRSNFRFKYNEFYFLTHPSLFIEDHFPEQKESQLLVPHVSLKQFERNVCHSSQFYNLGLLSSQPDKGVIETENGNVSIIIESRHPVLFSFTLNKNEKPGLIMLNEHGMKLDVYPQKTGQHVLNIFAKNADSEEEYPFIMEYRIVCKSVNTSMKIPKCLNNPVGPSWLSEKAGLLQPSHSEPVIHTKDGCCTISFVLEQDLKLFSTLYSEETELDRRYIFRRETENKVEFKVRLPQSGAYVLCVNVKLKNSDSYMSQCNYIITCTNTAVKWPVFPLTYANWANNYELVEPLDGVLAENRNVTFKLHIPGVAAVSVKGKSYFPLTLSASGHWEGTCSIADINEIYVMVMYLDQPNTWNYMLKYQVENK